MASMLIGDVARRTDLRPSTLRYYEKEGLLEPPARASGRRRYDAEVLGRIAVIKLALQAGFTIAETRLFISGFSPQTRPSHRWRILAERKLGALDAEMARIATMKAVLEASFRCGCVDLAVCEKLIANPATRTTCAPSCCG